MVSKFCDMFRCLTGKKKLRLETERAARRKTLVRIISQYFARMTANSSQLTDCDVGGPLGRVLPMFPKEVGFNCTAIVDYYGEPGPEGNHSGIIGHLQADTADVSTIPFRFPLEGDPVTFGHVVFADSLSFTTFYKRPKPPVADNDLMASLLLIDLQVWMCLLFLVISICAVLRRQGSRSPMFKVIQCFFQMTSRQTRAVSSRALGLTTIMGFFVIAMFYSNFMLSNLVRQEKPSVLQFFFDVLKPDAKMYFTSENQILSELKRSTDPRIRRVVAKVERQDLKDTMLAEGMEGFRPFCQIVDDV
ncbi:hypothetical protein HDE_00191 [Halotydeus destructor]|nr:hypothetical protein HDE_00191 [Halotydeus destructor]